MLGAIAGVTAAAVGFATRHRPTRQYVLTAIQTARRVPEWGRIEMRRPPLGEDHQGPYLGDRPSQ